MNNKIQHEKKCCDNPHIDIQDGYNVCLNCGVVFDVTYSNQERRAFTRDEIINRKRTEPCWRKFGTRTIIPSDRKDSKGNLLGPEKKRFYSRLSKIHSSLITGIERNLWVAQPMMKLLISKLNLPKYVYKTAWKIYVTAAKKKMTMGRSVEGFIAAALYVAIRVHDIPIFLDEINDISMIPKRVIFKSLGLLIRKVLPELDIKYKPIKPKELIYRFGSELNIPLSAQQKAEKILEKSSKAGVSFNGKDPKGFAASALYIAIKSTQHKKTQADVSDIANITDVTLRSRLKDIKESIS